MALMVVGGLSVPIEYDATAFIFTLMVGIPLYRYFQIIKEVMTL